MTSSTDLHVVLGATGGAGNAIVHALAAAGLTVRGVNRAGNAAAPAGVELLAADISVGADLERAVAGAAVVYMAAQPPYHQWPELFPPMLERVIDAVAAVDGKLVMVDNAYGYGPGRSPLTEDLDERATDKKGATRRRMTRKLLDAQASGRLRVAIGRASDYYGPGGENSGITALAIAPARAARGALRWMGTLDAPHSVAYLPDIASAYVVLGTSDAADGQIWHLPHGPAVTGRQFTAAVNAHLAEPRKVRVVSTAMLRMAAPFHRISRESLGIAYQWTEPFVLDSTKFEAAFGPFATTPLDDAIAATLQIAPIAA